MTVNEAIIILEILKKNGYGQLPLVMQTEKDVSQIEVYKKKDEKFVDLN